MKAKNQKNSVNTEPEFKPDDCLNQKMVKWVEDGIFNQGIVTHVFEKYGTQQLSVMTIFGKRRTVKLSKVKIVEVSNRIGNE